MMVAKVLEKQLDCITYQQKLYEDMQLENVEVGRGPPTVLTDDEEDSLAKYLIKMSEMGFGLNRETVMEMAYKIVN